MSIVLYLGIFAGFVALFYSFIQSRKISKVKLDNEDLIRISSYISEGASAFLKREYILLLPFVLVVALLLFITNVGVLKYQALAFIIGASFSALAGYLGMKVATLANARTAQKAKIGIREALKIAFAGGSVMGMTVVGLALLGISGLLYWGKSYLGNEIAIYKDMIFPIVTGFSLGASSVALFARVGGGIYTKAADVGADLVGKVEAGIPEDDPRNPAVIADNVGDNVGDVAGMGADLFESYVGSSIGCMVLGASTNATDEVKFILALLPILLCSVGIIGSIIGTLFVKGKEGVSPQKSLNTGTFVATFITILIAAPLVYFIMGDSTFNSDKSGIHIIMTILIGLISGLLIGLFTEYYTAKDKNPVKKLSKSCDTGPATTIISGISLGMFSTFPPILVLAIAIISSFSIAGLYGIGITALGMLLTLGIQLSVDAYGPIADNAGGLAVMSSMEPKVREITDDLDAVGNTTAAVGKGFAIGSAALTAIILFSAFAQTFFGSSEIHFDITNPDVLVGMLVGGMLPFLFSALSMEAISVAAFAMIEEVRRQFREKPGILTEKETPDYTKCVEISTHAALMRMIVPGLIAVGAPIVIGVFFGIYMLGGFLGGATVSGVLLAIFMANSGGAWDNAKKLIESKNNGKNSEAHKASVIGDTVGDPFKDTAGPALNILIKLMSIIALVIAPLLKTIWGL